MNKQDKVTKKEKVKKHGQKSEQELMASRFRMLNEKLYTTPSKESFRFFKENEDCFQSYHDGFKHQVEKWPKNPVDIFIKVLKNSKYHDKVIADLGCGEGKLELALKADNPDREIYSYDIGKINDHVIQADIAHLPLENNTLDVAVFCLSLMSTNYVDILIEANRKLKEGGVLLVAEVSSRLNIDKFVSLLELLGFVKKKVSYKALNKLLK